MAAYARLTPEAWQPLSQRQAAALLHTCLHDLRNADDLALRHAGSQALARFVQGAAVATVAAGDEPPAGGSLLSAAQRTLFPQLKRGLAAPNLAVRQVRGSLVALGFWAALQPALAALASPEPPLNLPCHLPTARRSILCCCASSCWPFPLSTLSCQCSRVRGGHTARQQLWHDRPCWVDRPAVRRCSPCRSTAGPAPCAAPLSPPADSDAEVDFLLNVAHIQLHRRARALTRLTRLLRGGEGAPPPLGVGALVGVVQPLLLQMIVEGKAGDGDGGGGHEQKQADRDRGANVTDAAVVALGAVAGCLPWAQYQQLLGQHLHLMKRHAGERACRGQGQGPPPGRAASGSKAHRQHSATPSPHTPPSHTDDDASKAVIRAVCLILDAFHFPLPTDADAEELAAALPAEAPSAPSVVATAMAAKAAAAEAAAAMDAEGEGAGAGEEGSDAEELPHADAAGAAASAAAAAVPTVEVYRMLARRAIPELQRIMVTKDTVRAPVALAGEWAACWGTGRAAAAPPPPGAA